MFISCAPTARVSSCVTRAHIRRGLATVVLAVLSLSGCARLRQSSAPARVATDLQSMDRIAEHGLTNLCLSAEERSFARALAYYSEGLIEEKKGGLTEEDIEPYLHAIDLDPTRQNLYAKVAVLYLRQKKVREAVEILERSCENNPDSVQARVDLAVTHEILGQNDKAVARYRDAARIAPKLSPLYTKAASLLLGDRKVQEAQDLLDLGLQRTSGSPTILAFCLTWANRHAGDRAADAIRCLETATRRASRDNWQFHQYAFITLANLYLGEDTEKSVSTLERADRVVRDDPAILTALGIAHSYRKNYASAVKVLRRADETVQAKNPNPRALSASFYLHYGAAYERAGRFDEAVKVFEKCLVLYPDADDVLNYLAYMWAEKGVNLDRALIYASRALESESENGAYVDTLGWIYFRMGRYELAREQIQRASEIIPNDATILEHLGDAWLTLGQTEKAVDSWKRSYAADPAVKAVAVKLRAHGVDPATLPQPPPRDGKKTSL